MPDFLQISGRVISGGQAAWQPARFYYPLICQPNKNEDILQDFYPSLFYNNSDREEFT